MTINVVRVPNNNSNELKFMFKTDDEMKWNSHIFNLLTIQSCNLDLDRMFNIVLETRYGTTPYKIREVPYDYQDLYVPF